MKMIKKASKKERASWGFQGVKGSYEEDRKKQNQIKNHENGEKSTPTVKIFVEDEGEKGERL